MKYLLGFMWGLWVAFFIVGLWVRFDGQGWPALIITGIALTAVTFVNIITDGDLFDL